MATAFRCLLTLGAVGLLCASPAASQQRASTLPSAKPKAPPPAEQVPAKGVIDGMVTDSSFVPLAGAEIGILRTPLRVATSAQGRFRITDVQMGTYILIIRRFGYSPVASVISVRGGDTLRLTYSLQPLQAGRLDTVRVIERQESRNLTEFERRRRLGVGKFMTSTDLEKRGSIDVAVVLRSFSELAVVRDDNTGVTSVQNRRDQGNLVTASGAGACPVQIVVDNVLMPREVDVELLPRPKEIAGIEVYSGPSGIPAQFGGQDRRCGMVLLWTKVGTSR